MSTFALLDSGSSLNFLSRSFVEHFGLSTCKGPAVRATLADGAQLTMDDVVGLELAFGVGGTGGHRFTIECYVLESLSHDLVLGLGFLQAYNPAVDWQCCTMTFHMHDVVVHATHVGKALVE